VKIRKTPDHLNPERLAVLDLELWQLYYGHRWIRLAWRLVNVLREGFGLSRVAAWQTAFWFGRAAMRFRQTYFGKGAEALPDLRRGYAVVRRDSGLTFDPQAVAEAELAWWEARRDPSRSQPEQVGELMAELYARLYGGTHHRFVAAAQLRAEAAWLRDQHEADPPWPRIHEGLQASYRELKNALQG
jgi:hypothetical protein